MNLRKGKWLLLLSMFLLALLCFSACGPKQGIPDRTGSWSQINQSLERDASWKKIVTDSEFQLGEKTVKGSWNTPSGQEEYYELDYGSYPNLDGSTVAVPMAVEFARQILGLSDQDATDFVYFNTTHTAYENLIGSLPNKGSMIRSTNCFLDENHPVDLIIATEPSPEELALAGNKQVELYMAPVCYDAFVFITHKDNPVQSLTVEEIQKIYTGEITNWQEVGGQDARIELYQREKNSGSQTAMEKLVMQGKPMLPPAMTKVAAGMGALVDAVAEYKNTKFSLGYTYQYYIDSLYKNENIKVLSVNDIAPDPEKLRNETYPFTTRYYGVIRKDDKDNIGGKFLDWMLSEEGQRCIAQAGYIPLNEPQ